MTIEMIPMCCLLQKIVVFSFEKNVVLKKWFKHLCNCQQAVDVCQIATDLPVKIKEFHPVKKTEVSQEWIVTNQGFGTNPHKIWFDFSPEIRICTAIEVEALPIGKRINSLVVESGNDKRKIVVAEGVDDMVTLFLTIWIRDQKVKRSITSSVSDAIAKEFPLDSYDMFTPEPTFSNEIPLISNSKDDFSTFHKVSFAEDSCPVPPKASSSLEILSSEDLMLRTVIVAPVLRPEPKPISNTPCVIDMEILNTKTALPLFEAPPLDLDVDIPDISFRFRVYDDRLYFGQTGESLWNPATPENGEVTAKINRLPFYTNELVQPPVIERIRQLGHILSGSKDSSHAFGELCGLISLVLSHEASSSLLAHLYSLAENDPQLLSCFPARPFGKLALVTFVFRLLSKRKLGRLVALILEDESLRQSMYSGASVMRCDDFIADFVKALPTDLNPQCSVSPNLSESKMNLVPRFDTQLEKACADLNLTLVRCEENSQREEDINEVVMCIIQFLQYKLLMKHTLMSIFETVVRTMRDQKHVAELANLYKVGVVHTEQTLVRVITSGVKMRIIASWVLCFIEVALTHKTHAPDALVYVRGCCNRVCAALASIRNCCL